MFALAPTAASLAPEVREAMSRFFRSLSPRLVPLVQEVRLFGDQARRHSAEAPYQLLLVVHERNAGLRAALNVAADDTRRGLPPDSEVRCATVTMSEWSLPDATSSFEVRNARREGVVLYRAA